MAIKYIIEKKHIDVVVELLKEFNNKKIIGKNYLVEAIMVRAGVKSETKATKILNKAVECGAIKVIQNGKRKTFYLPED